MAVTFRSKENLVNSTARKAIKGCLNDAAYVYNRKGNKATEDGLKALSKSL